MQLPATKEQGCVHSKHTGKISMIICKDWKKDPITTVFRKIRVVCCAKNN